MQGHKQQLGTDCGNAQLQVHPDRQISGPDVPMPIHPDRHKLQLRARPPVQEWPLADDRAVDANTDVMRKGRELYRQAELRILQRREQAARLQQHPVADPFMNRPRTPPRRAQLAPRQRSRPPTPTAPTSAPNTPPKQPLDLQDNLDHMPLRPPGVFLATNQQAETNAIRRRFPRLLMTSEVCDGPQCSNEQGLCARADPLEKTMVWRPLVVFSREFN